MLDKILSKDLPVITLCGSIRFKEEFIKVKESFENKGCLVLMPIFFNDSLIKKQSFFKLKDSFYDIHKEKIKACDLVYVINKYGYVGSDTLKEIAYAKSLKKPIIYLETTCIYTKDI